MRWVFWASASVIGYTYVGYAAWLWIRGRLRPRPVRRAPHLPFISIALVVRNEEETLARKLRNLAGLDYPADRVQVVVVSDGSTDGTEEILAAHAGDARFRVIASAQSRGKASGINDAIRAAEGEIVVFTDARQQMEASAVRLLMENFADPQVGCVSGELMLGDPGQGETAKGMGLYWRVEKKIREMESASGSVVGATGAIYAVRRELLASLPAGTILDDVYLPMNVAKQGGRVLFDARARAWDAPNLGDRREFSRKVRTLSGNYQLLQVAPWLLGEKNPLRFEFVSHKLLRLFIPFALATVLLSSALVHGTFYLVALWGQVVFYAAALLAIAKVKLGAMARIADPASTFVVLNAAAVVAFTHFITGRKAEWAPVGIATRRSTGTDPRRGVS